MAIRNWTHQGALQSKQLTTLAKNFLSSYCCKFSIVCHRRRQCPSTTATRHWTATLRWTVSTQVNRSIVENCNRTAGMSSVVSTGRKLRRKTASRNTTNDSTNIQHVLSRSCPVHLPCELESRETHICIKKWNDKSCNDFTLCNINNQQTPAV